MTEKSMQLITRMWTPLALEYAKFLNRYKLETVLIISGKNRGRVESSIFADEERYLNLTNTNEQFRQEEKQLTSLFNTIEKLYFLLIGMKRKEEYYEEFENEYDELDFEDDED